jgi:hypothetical protein
MQKKLGPKKRIYVKTHHKKLARSDLQKSSKLKKPRKKLLHTYHWYFVLKVPAQIPSA